MYYLKSGSRKGCKYGYAVAIKNSTQNHQIETIRESDYALTGDAETKIQRYYGI